MDDTKSEPPRPELVVRRAAEGKPDGAVAPGAGIVGPAEQPITAERRARAERLISAKGLQAARALDPSIAGHCIECWAPVEGNRAFCSDACITARVKRNREQVAAIAREDGPKKPRR